MFTQGSLAAQKEQRAFKRGLQIFIWLQGTYSLFCELQLNDKLVIRRQITVSLVTTDFWVVADSATIWTAELKSLLVCFVMGCSEASLRLQPKFLIHDWHFLFGDVNRPDSLLFHRVFPSMFSSTQLRCCRSDLHDGHVFLLGTHLEMQIASPQSHTPCQTAARALSCRWGILEV